MNIYLVILSNTGEMNVRADSFSDVEKKMLEYINNPNIHIKSIEFIMKIDL